MNSKERNWTYGVKPRNVPPPATEELPRSPMKRVRGYCKRLKGDHVFELVDVKVYPWYHYPGGWGSTQTVVTGFTHFKEYRCTGCQKKRTEQEQVQLDTPVKREALSIPR